MIGLSIYVDMLQSVLVKIVLVFSVGYKTVYLFSVRHCVVCHSST